MKSPEKIYLQVCGDCKDNDCKNCKFEDLEDNVTWCKDEIFDKDIEYTRTDAFIEKAVFWLKENADKYITIKDGAMQLGIGFYIKFKRAMKGE